jgi:hypothetical protein
MTFRLFILVSIACLTISVSNCGVAVGCAGPGSTPTAIAPPTTTSKQHGSGGSQPGHDTTNSSDLSSGNTEQPPTLALVAAPHMPLQLATGHTQAAAAAAAATASKGGSSASAQQQQQVEDAEVMDLMSALAQQPPPPAAAAPSQPETSAAAAAAQAADAVSAAASSAAEACEAFDLEGDESLCVVCWERPCTVGLLHGEDVHLCMCAVCFAAYDVSNSCPMCRRPVEDSVDLA